MTTIALAIAAAAIALGVARALDLPPAVLAILAGVGLGLLPIALDAELVQSGLLLAATFLIFASGTEIDRENVARYRPIAVVVTILYLLVTVAIALMLWRVLRLDTLTLTYLVLALSSSSTVVAVDLFRKREQFYEPVGRVVRAISLTQDAAIIAILSLAVLVTGDVVSTQRALIAVSVLGVGTWLVKGWLAPKVLVQSRLSEEERLLFVLALLFLFAGICWWAGLPFVLGVFLAGLSLSAFPVGGTVRSYVVSFSDFFTVLFFVFLGTFVSVPNPAQLTAEMLFIGGVFLLRPLLLWPIIRRVGLNTRSSITAITALANSGELALVVILIGLGLGHVDEGLLSVVAAVVVITMALSPLASSDAVVHWLTRWYPRRQSPPQAPPQDDYVVMVGCGETGQLVLERLRHDNVPVVVIDEDPDVVARLSERGVRAIRGDGSDPKVLARAGAKGAKIVVSTIGRMADNARVLSSLPDQKVLVRVFSDTAAQAIRDQGGLPVVEARLATEAFLALYEQQDTRGSPLGRGD